MDKIHYQYLLSNKDLKARGNTLASLVQLRNSYLTNKKILKGSV